MLEDLKILNGNMSLEFDTFNTLYTVFVDAHVTSLEMEYRLKDGVELSVIGNENFSYGKNEVVLTVWNDTEMESYYLYVTREHIIETTNTLEDVTRLEIDRGEVWEYAIPVISSICFLIILFTFTFLFKKRKNTKNNKTASRK